MANRIVWGISIMIAGVVLILISPKFNLIPLIYGIPLFIIGLIIFLNKKEEEIEQIKGGKK